MREESYGMSIWCPEFIFGAFSIAEEFLGERMSDMNKKKMTTQMITQIGMLGAIATVLMLFEIPLPFAPSFYEIDFSEVPVLIGCFSMGPLAGALIELVKIVLNFVINGTATAGVGEVANYIIGISFCIPAGVIYKKRKTKKAAIIGLVVGTLFMTILGCFVNAYILLPTFAAAFKMPIDALIEMGTAVNANITNLFTFVMFAVAPFNLLKGVLDSIIVMAVYKKISPILKLHH
jgi:riboflavin transporter FmnP